MKIIFSFVLYSTLLISNSWANSQKVGEHEAASEASPEKSPDKANEENAKNNDLLDFSSIKDIIKKDGLEGELKKKQDEKRKFLDEKKRIEMRRFNVPTEDIFWSMFSELWLVKNATKLKWDFHKPDFELEKAFALFLESQGFYEKKFKILLLDTTEITHVALPSNSDEVILMLSLPFVRTMDLSKVEISLILFEDFIRLRRGYFKSYVTSKELEAFLGTNFNGKPFNKKIIEDHLKKYNTVLFEKGFSFQDQFEVTKEMDGLLKSDLKIWNTYLTLIGKIDQLVKGNVLYKNYSQIYPSPELQLNWLKPKESIL
jgi:hypothetical protein